jgi:hypothetical protein
VSSREITMPECGVACFQSGSVCAQERLDFDSIDRLCSEPAAARDHYRSHCSAASWLWGPAREGLEHMALEKKEPKIDRFSVKV